MRKVRTWNGPVIVIGIDFFLLDLGTLLLEFGKLVVARSMSLASRGSQEVFPPSKLGAYAVATAGPVMGRLVPPLSK